MVSHLLFLSLVLLILLVAVFRGMYSVFLKWIGSKVSHSFSPPEEMIVLAQQGNVSTQELYEVWNGGNGMILALPEQEVEKHFHFFEI